MFARQKHTRGVRYPQNQKTPVLFCFAPGAPSLVAETWDPSTVTIAVLSTCHTKDSSPVTMFLKNCTSSHEHSNKSHAIVWHFSRWSSVSKCGTNIAHTHFMCRLSDKIASHEPTEIPQSSAISRTVNLLLLRMIVLTLAIFSSFLDADGCPKRGSLSTEVLPSLNRRNQSNTCVRPTASSPYACCNNWYVSVAVFPILKQNLMQMCC